jgi:hypothetical protein
MTLIVARVTPLGVRIAADMRVTDPYEIQRGFLYAALKPILLSPTFCIAYAGLVSPALAAIRRVHADGLDLEAATSYLHQAHESSDRNVDFLVASLRPRTLIAIKEGRSSETGAEWIGDHVAFSDYQREYHRNRPYKLSPEMFDRPDRAEDIEVATRMSDGMRAVVDGPTHVVEDGIEKLVIPRGGSHPTVGEAIVNVVPRVEDDLFAYSHYNRADFEGSLSYFFLSPSQPGVGAVGLYFMEGRLGVLYAPLAGDDPMKYPRVSLAQFVELVRLRHGISLEGLVA